jgi:hypothetical protein
MDYEIGWKGNGREKTGKGKLGQKFGRDGGISPKGRDLRHKRSINKQKFKHSKTSS